MTPKATTDDAQPQFYDVRQAKTNPYRDEAPTSIEVAGSCPTCLDGVLIVAARGNGWLLFKCLNCNTTHTEALNDTRVATEPISSAATGGGGQTSGLPGGPDSTQAPVAA